MTKPRIVNRLVEQNGHTSVNKAVEQVAKVEASVLDSCVQVVQKYPTISLVSGFVVGGFVGWLLSRKK